jgi:hypothetical protein
MIMKPSGRGDPRLTELAALCKQLASRSPVRQQVASSSACIN